MNTELVSANNEGYRFLLFLNITVKAIVFFYVIGDSFCLLTVQKEVIAMGRMEWVKKIMIVFVFFYDRSQLNIGTILYQLVYSFCVDLFADAHVYSTHLWLNAVIMLLGVMLFAVGTGFYASASMGRGSYEALTFSLAEKNHWQVKGVRMVLDVLMVIVGVVLGGKFGICAIATILFSGPVIQFTTIKTKKLLAI